LLIPAALRAQRPPPAPPPFFLIRDGYPIFSLAYSPDGKRIVTAGGRSGIVGFGIGGRTFSEGEVLVWDLNTREVKRSLEGYDRHVTSVCFSPPDGKRIAANAGHGVMVWDAATGKRQLTLEHEGTVLSVCFSPDGRRIAAVGYSSGKPGMVKVWDAKTGKELLSFKAHDNSIGSVCFSPDGKRIVSSDRGKKAEVWDAQTGQKKLSLKDTSGRAVFSPDGKRIAAGSTDKTVKVWDAQSGKELLSLQGHTGRILVVTFSPDRNRIASDSDDLTVKLWDAQSGKEIDTFEHYLRTGS